MPFPAGLCSAPRCMCVSIGLHRCNSAHVGTKLNSTHSRSNTDMIALLYRMRDERYGRIGNELSLLRARGSMYVCIDSTASMQQRPRGDKTKQHPLGDKH